MCPANKDEETRSSTIGVQHQSVPIRSSNLIKCKDCGRLISKRARNCPICGAPIGREWSGSFFYIIVGSIILFSILVVIAGYMRSGTRFQEGKTEDLGASSLRHGDTPAKGEEGSQKPAKVVQDSPHPAGEEMLAKANHDANLVLVGFKELTEVQKKVFAEAVRGGYLTGSGTIEDVQESSIFSEVKGNYYEISVKLPSGNYAVVSYGKGNNWVVGISKGESLNFKGRIKNIKHWGFWSTAYILGE